MPVWPVVVGFGLGPVGTDVGASYKSHGWPTHVRWSTVGKWNLDWGCDGHLNAGSWVGVSWIVLVGVVAWGVATVWSGAVGPGADVNCHWWAAVVNWAWAMMWAAVVNWAWAMMWAAVVNWAWAMMCWAWTKAWTAVMCWAWAAMSSSTSMHFKIKFILLINRPTWGSCEPKIYLIL